MKFLKLFLMILFVNLVFTKMIFSQQDNLFSIAEGVYLNEQFTLEELASVQQVLSEQILSGQVLPVQTLLEQYLKLNKIRSSDVYLQSWLVKIENLSEIQENGRIKINLPGTSCNETVYKAKDVEYYSEDDYYWHGELMAEDSCSCSDGNLTIISKNGRKYGQISIDEKLFEIQDLSGRMNIVSEIDNSKFDSQVCGIVDRKAEDDDKAGSFLGGEKNVGNCNVRVLVLFTDAANAVEANILDRIDMAMHQTNQVLSNSRIFSCDLRVRLAGTPVLIPIPFVEDAEDAEADLRGIATDSTIAVLRDTRNADIVILLTEGNYNSGELYGLAFIGLDEATAYALVETESATSGRYTFAHEVGHLFGAGHDDDLRQGIPHGHKFIKCFKRYPSVLHTTKKNNRIPYYSNPDVEYKGRRTGRPNSRDNAQVLRNAGCTVANFRDDPSSSLFASIESENDTEVYPIESVCPCSHTSLEVNIYGLPGPYMYEWSVSSDGINYSDILSTSEYFGIDAATFCQPEDGEWCFEACLGVNVFVRLQVTTSSGAQRTVTRRFITDDAWPEQQWGACEDEFEGLIIPSSSEVYIPESDAFFVYPNPTKGEINIDFKIETDEYIDIKIADIKSQNTINLFSAPLVKGRHALNFDSGELPPGVYFVKIRVGDKLISRKLVFTN